MKWIEYAIALSVGLAIGWSAQAWLSSSTDNPQNEAEVVLEEPPEIKIVDLQQKETVAEFNPGLEPVVKAPEQVEDWTATDLIGAIHAMDKTGFEDFINALQSKRIKLSRELIEDLLDDLLTVSDPSTRHRIIELLGFDRFANLNQAGIDEIGVEALVMDKIRSNEQSPQWLDVLSYWGVQNQEHAIYLADSLDSHYEAGPRISSMLALSKGIRVDMLQGDDSRQKIAASIQPYLDSEHELERAAAIRAQNNYPAEGYAGRLKDALDDPSEKVRINAALAMIEGQRLNSGEIKNSLMRNMQSSSNSAEERLASYSILRVLPLEGEHYEAVYDFRINHAYKLEQQQEQERASEYSPW